MTATPRTSPTMFRVDFGKGKRKRWLYFSDRKARVEPNGILCVLFDGEIRRFDSSHWERVHKQRLRGEERIKALASLVQAAGGPICALCKEQFALSELTLDHIKPLSMGGSNRLSNLQLACGPCNQKKGSEWDAEEECST